MQRKLKSILRSASKRKSHHSSEEQTQNSGATPPRSSESNERRPASVEVQRRPQTSDAYTKSAPQNGQVQNLSSGFAPRKSTVAQSPSSAVDHTQPHQRESTRDSITNDYRAYLPVLAPENHSRNEQTTLGGDRRLTTGEGESPYEEDVANRNIDRYGLAHDDSKRRSNPTTPPVLDTRDQASQGALDRRESVGSAVPSMGTATTGNYSRGQDTATKGGLIDRILPHTEATAHEKNQWKSKNFPSKSARVEPQAASSRRRPRGSESEEEAPCSPPSDYVNHNLPSKSHQGPLQETKIAEHSHDTIGEEIEKLLDGVVDLRNTVDEDKQVTWAPAVTHEVVKPHEHEIIQHKIYREIHNYEYYHHVQPVYHIEVLPPRHWKPNPNGEGLVEISADDMPWRTGQNRRWKIIHEQSEIPVEYQPVWRTEPEIIEHPVTITEEGFERKETTIRYPPVLQDMTEYDGPVQPVHFDHKTGERWLGEITTMHKLRNELGQLADPGMSMKELGEALPEVPGRHEVPELSPSPELKRKPLNGPVPAQVAHLGRNEGIAVAV